MNRRWEAVEMSFLRSGFGILISVRIEIEISMKFSILKDGTSFELKRTDRFDTLRDIDKEKLLKLYVSRMIE